MSRVDPDGFDPFGAEDLRDSWEPPSPALGGPGQLLAALVAAVVVGVILLGTLAALSWLVRGG